jgi:hypothetical protein
MIILEKRDNGMYVIEHNGLPYHVTEAEPAGDITLAAVQEYANMHPDEIGNYSVPEPDNMDEIAELKTQLDSLDWRTTKATEEAALQGLALHEFIATDDGAGYKEVLEEKQRLRAKINELEAEYIFKE